VKSDWSLKTLYDVIAKLPGTTEANEWIVRGNHHDAWVNGAQDPISGLVAELEEARALGSLYQQGWRPKRTIIYAAWDGEEPGLLGSTEWVEAHADELKTHAVAYLNSDTNSRGYLGVEGSHSLEKVHQRRGEGCRDPESGVSSWKRLQSSRIVGGSPEVRRDAREREDLRISALGSGSDYSSFLDHLGIASLNLATAARTTAGSITRFTMTSIGSRISAIRPSSTSVPRASCGTAVLRLANADLLPFAFYESLRDRSGLCKGSPITPRQAGRADCRTQPADRGRSLQVH